MLLTGVKGIILLTGGIIIFFIRGSVFKTWLWFFYVNLKLISTYLLFLFTLFFCIVFTCKMSINKTVDSVSLNNMKMTAVYRRLSVSCQSDLLLSLSVCLWEWVLLTAVFIIFCFNQWTSFDKYINIYFVDEFKQKRALLL